MPNSWFTDKYTRYFSDTATYRPVDNFDFNTTVTNSNDLLKKLKLRFHKLLTPNHIQSLNPVSPNLLQLPYMKLLPKVHGKKSKRRQNTTVDFLRQLMTTALYGLFFTALENLKKLITNNSFPWLPYNTHRKRTQTKRKTITTNCLLP